MPRLPLILCVIALLGSTVSAVLFFQIGNSKQLLELRLADAGVRANKLDASLAAANEQNGSLKARVGTLDSALADTKATLADAKAILADTKARLAATDARVVQLDRDLADTKRVLTVYEDTARALGEEVAALRQDLDDSRTSNASPEAVLAYKNTIAELERQLATARNGAALTAGASASTAVFASRVGRATVLSVGPQNSFVVLNFGSARGAHLGQKLTVNQGTAVVATVLISDVRANFSIAQVLPETLRGVLQKGDSAVLLR
ncbi:MAG: hypothetical protein EXS37_14805 [Opitutus sp.]|nr:hypothetical protein [Opitutus sp.]